MKLLKLLLSLIVSFQTLNAQVSTEQDLATILMSIGDSVKQATLTPVERYNRFKPSERSYLGVSYLMPNKGEGRIGRIELFHKVGLYIGTPNNYTDENEPNTTFEEITSSQQMATLQGTSYSPSNYLDSSISFNSIDFGLILAPWNKNLILKNVFISMGLVNYSTTRREYYSNNQLIDVQGDFILDGIREQKIAADFSLKYVIPYVQLSVGYSFNQITPGIYSSVGVNVPLRIIVKKGNLDNHHKWFRNKINEIDRNAKNFSNSNF